MTLRPAICVAILACGCTAKESLPVPVYDAVALPVRAPGVHKLECPAPPGGRAMKYVISVPEAIEPGSKVPLVVTLHYGGKEGDHYGESMVTDFTGPAVADLNAVVVGPDSLVGDDWDLPVNSAHVAFLTKCIAKSYPIDDRKIVLTGFSAGGIGTWYIASRSPELYSAAIPVAGDPKGNAKDWKLPVYAIHATADEIVRIGPTRRAITDLAARGSNAKLNELGNGVTHYETAKYAPAMRDAVKWLETVWQ